MPETAKSAATAAELIKLYGGRADEEMAALKSACPLTKEWFTHCMQGYILDKFLLERDELKSERFNDIAEQSIAKSAGVDKSLVKEFDQARSCSGTSSVMAKKVLLFLKIQRELGILLPADRSAAVGTLTDLTDLIWEEVLKTPDSCIHEKAEKVTSV